MTESGCKERESKNSRKKHLRIQTSTTMTATKKTSLVTWERMEEVRQTKGKGIKGYAARLKKKAGRGLNIEF